MAHYFLKANLDGVEIEFNTKDRSIVQSQLDEYFEIITGKAPKRTQEPQRVEAQVQYENFENFNFNAQNQTNNAQTEEKKPFSFESYENRKEEIAKEEPQYIQEQVQETPQITPQVEVNQYVAQSAQKEEPQGSFGEIFKAKSADLDEKSNIEYENIEIKKENIAPIENNQGLDLYQPKKTPELPEFMRNKVSNGIFDDFIITAYFIKNVLGEKRFTVKYLNSKLYRAKEKLVDFAILNESLTKGLIQVVSATEYGKEYSLTELGENYYLGLENR